ncbi:hypothetical protein [Methanosarcina sp. MTP4]|nr:hypothetical protein [Methanosarcina sp. MTP4]
MMKKSKIAKEKVGIQEKCIDFIVKPMHKKELDIPGTNFESFGFGVT